MLSLFQCKHLTRIIGFCFQKGCTGALLFAYLIITSSLSLANTNFPQINIAYKYDPNALVHCQYRLAASEDSIHVYLKIDAAMGDLLEDYKLTYSLKGFYDSKSPHFQDSLNVADYLLVRDNGSYYLKVPLKREPNVNLLLLQISYNDIVYYFDILLENDFLAPSLVLMEEARSIPVFDSYVPVDNRYRLIDSFDTSDTTIFYCYQYNHIFSPALPPMSTRVEEVDRALTIDSMFAISAHDHWTIRDEALYFIQEDTTTLRGIAYRGVPNYYPKYRRVEELIEPLVYISTRSEMSKLSKASDLKQALDKYWLELMKTPSRAKMMIKSYYDRIEAANAVFTTYKEGWKTDQGMIYALYGVPDEVYFDGEEEQWIYKKNDGISRVKFTFVKVKNIFTDRHFELLRSKSYESFWFGNVELWRKGIKGL